VAKSEGLFISESAHYVDIVVRTMATYAKALLGKRKLSTAYVKLDETDCGKTANKV